MSLVGKSKYKSNVIWTMSSPVGRSSRPTPRRTTLYVSFLLLTCIKLRFLLSILRFKVSDSFFQRSCVGLSIHHSIALQNHWRQALSSLLWILRKSQQKFTTVNRLTEGNSQNQALKSSSIEVKFLTLGSSISFDFLC